MSFQFFPSIADTEIEREGHRHRERLRYLREQLEAEITESRRYMGGLAIAGVARDELQRFADETYDEVEQAQSAFEGFYAFLSNGYQTEIEDDETEASMDTNAVDTTISTYDTPEPIEDTSSDLPDVSDDEFDTTRVDGEAERIADLLSFLRLYVERRGLSPTEPFEINIGAIARELNNGNDLEKEDFHNLIQWINRQWFVVDRRGSIYTIQLPDVEMSSSATGIEIPANIASRLRELIMGSPDMGASLHINQVCDLLGLYGMSKGEKRTLLEQLADSGLFTRERMFVVVAPFATVQLQPSRVEPDADEASSVATPLFTMSEVLDCIDNQKFRHITEMCSREEGARVEELKAALEEIFGEFTKEAYEEFKHVGFPEIRALIQEQLVGRGVVARWKDSGRNRGKRYKIIIDNLVADRPVQEPAPQPAPSPRPVKRLAPVQQPPLPRMERFARRDTEVVNGSAMSTPTITERERRESRHIIDRNIGINPTKKADVVKMLTNGGVDPSHIDVAIQEMVARGELIKIRQKGSVYYSRG